MKLYRITRNHNIQFLKPSIPTKHLEDENITIPRISFSDSIDNFFMSVSWNSAYYNHWYHSNYVDDDSYITVFELDTDTLDEKHLITPKYVRRYYKVDDAEALNEYLVTGINEIDIKKYQIYPTKIRKKGVIIRSYGKCCNTCIDFDCQNCVEEPYRYSLKEYILI